MIKTNAILEFAEDLIHQKTETYCSELQRRILIAALQEERKTYDQLAEECGYSARYVKQDVAPKLWLLISQAVGEKVNKANVRAALEAAMRSRAPSQPQTQRPQHQVAQTPASSKTIKSISLQPEAIYKEQSRLLSRSQYANSRYIRESFLTKEQSAPDVCDPASVPLLCKTNSEMMISEVSDKANILLIDDQPQNLKLLSDLLDEQGIKTAKKANQNQP